MISRLVRPWGGASLHVGVGAWVFSHAGDGHHVGGGIGGGVAAAAQPGAGGAAAGGGLRHSRCRVLRPLLAGWGATAHRRAKAASLVSRLGLSPAVMSSCPAMVGPTPGRASRLGPV